jgi:hypothetical protein
VVPRLARVKPARAPGAVQLFIAFRQPASCARQQVNKAKQRECTNSATEDQYLDFDLLRSRHVRSGLNSTTHGTTG